MNFQIQGKFRRRESVEVTGAVVNRDWLPVKSADGKTGYVAQRYLTDPPRPAAEPSKPERTNRPAPRIGSAPWFSRDYEEYYSAEKKP